MITADPSKPPARARWNTPLNLGLLAAALVLALGATLLGSQVISFRHQTVALHKAAAKAKPVTKEAASDQLPPSGTAVVTLSGSGARTSKVHPLDFSWTGAWSANCRDVTGNQVLRISLHSYPSGSLVADYAFTVSGYQSGSLPGHNIARGYFEVSSTCDWSLAVVDTELPAP